MLIRDNMRKSEEVLNNFINSGNIIICLKFKKLIIMEHVI